MKISWISNFVKFIKHDSLIYVLKYLFNKGKKVFLYLINSLWALPLVVLSRLIRPFVILKFGMIFAERIGHFIIDGLEVTIIARNESKKSITFVGMEEVSNYQWLKMLKKELFISKKFKFLFFWNNIIPGGDQHIAVRSNNNGQDLKGIFYKNPIKLEMSKKNTSWCEQWLVSIGWKGEPFVCLIVRDNEYLAKSKIHANSLPLKKSIYTSQSHRNSKIETYREAVEYLLGKGYWVFRMGSITEKKLEIDHENFYDYSFSPSRSDLLDIYLFSNCTACISTSTGIDALPAVYGIPTLILNYMSLGTLPTSYNRLIIPKNLVWDKNHTSLTLKDYIESSFYDTKTYEEYGIKIIDLTSQEILDRTIEFVNRIENSENYDPLDEKIQKVFLNQLKKMPNYSSYHGFIHPNFKIGKHWFLSIPDKLIRDYD